MNSRTNSDKKKEKEQKLFNKKKIDDDMNYFKILKEIEKEEKNKESDIKNNKLNLHNLTEKIYLRNIDKIGKYYKKNENDIKLYGSKKYDDLTIQKLINEMGEYKSKVIKKITENKKNEKAGKNFGFESCDEKVILTPLAEREKEDKNFSESLEKKNFEDVQRTGVVMRRIEYVHLLDNRDGYKKRDTAEEDRKIILLLIEAIDKIERNWLLYKLRKMQKEEKERKEKERKEKERKEQEKKEREKKEKERIEKEKKEKEEKERERIENEKKEKREKEKKEKEEKERRKKEQEEFEMREKERIDRERKEKEEKEKKEKEKKEKEEKEKREREQKEKEEKENNIKINEINEENLNNINKLNELEESNETKEKKTLRNKPQNIFKNKNEIFTKIEEINFMILNEKSKDKYIIIDEKWECLQEENFFVQLLNKQQLDNDNNDDIQSIKIIYKPNKPCFITKILGTKKSSSEKITQKENIIQFEYKNIEKKNNYIKIKTQLDMTSLENKKLNNQIKELNDEIKKLNEEILNNKKEKEKLVKTNKEINIKLNANNAENEKLKQKCNSLEEKYNELLNNFNQIKNELTDEKNNKEELINEINNLNDLKKEQNINNENINFELEKIKNNLKIITNEKEKKDEEFNNIKLNLEQKIDTINSYEKEIDNLKSQIIEKEKINEANTEKNKKDIIEYQNKISLLEKEKEEMKNTNNILEEISNTNRDKYTKLFYQNKNDINKTKKEKEILKNENDLLKKKLDDIKKNEEQEKNEKMNILYIKDKYEKKIKNLNEIISELKNRIQNLFMQLSFMQKNTLINNNTADIFIKLKLMVLLIKICIDKKIIFEKREFFNILFKKYRNKFSSREKRIEYLREFNKDNGFPY